MNNYNVIKANLINVEMNLSKYIQEKIENVEYLDYLDVLSIDGNQIILMLGRKVQFLPSKSMGLDIMFEVELRTNDNIDLENFKKDLKEGIILLNSVYSKISLVIADLTNATIFGPLVTPPVYNKEKILIK